MLYYQTDLSSIELDFFREAVYLTEEESVQNYHPSTIPVVFNERLNINILDYKFANILSDNFGISLDETVNIISHYNQIPSDSIAISIDEYNVLLDPTILSNNVPFIIKATNENSADYIFCEIALNMYLDTGDERYLGCILDEGKYAKQYNDLANAIDDGYEADKKLDKRWIGDYSSSDIKQTMEKGAGAVNKLEHLITAYGNKYNADPTILKSTSTYFKSIEREMKHAPRTWLAKKIQSLRSLYQKWLAKANLAVDMKEAGIIKKIAAKIMNLIDKGMMLLQRGANHVGDEDYHYSMRGKW